MAIEDSGNVSEGSSSCAADVAFESAARKPAAKDNVSSMILCSSLGEALPKTSQDIFQYSLVTQVIRSCRNRVVYKTELGGKRGLGAWRAEAERSSCSASLCANGTLGLQGTAPFWAAELITVSNSGSKIAVSKKRFSALWK